MKKILLVGLTLMTFSGVFAQFNKGRMLAGGSVGFASTTDKTTSGGNTVTNGTTTTFSFGPNFGYFVADNLAVGAKLSLSSSKYSASSGGSSTTYSSFAFTPFIRYYIGPGFFGQGTFGLGSSKSEYNSGTSTSTSKGTLTTWSLGIGYAYFLNDHVAIEPLIQYMSNSTKYDTSGNPTDTQGVFAVGIGIGVYLGDRK